MKRLAGMAWARQAVAESISVLTQAYMLQIAPCCMVEVATMQPEEGCAEAYHRWTQMLANSSQLYTPATTWLPACLAASPRTGSMQVCRPCFHAHCPSQKPPETVSLARKR